MTAQSDSQPAASPPGDPRPDRLPAAAGTLRIEPIPAFRDNYIWLLERGGRAVVVDPGDAQPVLRILGQRKLHLDAILVTHHHADHVGGVPALVQATGAVVFGPAQSPFGGVDHPLRDADAIEVLGQPFQVLAVPGHTLDHIAYWSPPLAVVFCGDTLFAGGCGRLFEGTAAQMHASLRRLAALPGETRVYCAHEYTLSNLRFALAAEPDNEALRQRQARCARLREDGEPTVPSRIEEERRTNPFLRCAEPSLRTSVQARAGTGADSDELAVFAALRTWKDGF